MPLYTNNENLRVVDMCKIFDEEFPKPDRDDTKLFRYLYLIIYSVTMKERRTWFQNYDDFDGYAIYSARTLYIRFLKKLKEGEQLKSVLNYFKSCWDKLKVSYQNEEFAEVMNPEHDDFSPGEVMSQYTNNLSDDYYSKNREEDILFLFKNINKKAKEVIKETPYSNDEIMSHRLYISTLLTFLSNLTLTNKALAKYEKKSEKNIAEGDQFFSKLLLKEKEEAPRLWKLEPTMGDYVRMLVNKLKCKLANELRDIQAYYTLPEDVVTSILASAYNDGYKSTNSMEDD